ncbi:hypothetical protein AGLY_003221 [Aphis glycines]|uniref:Uncharacterized protein n=1 Tax=Aphis glycines TaxID=307491 RepID=A0A6G0U3F3_APHGL|nr:hypothetical protein AGLY_003221 [Aphis glycines]
MTFDDLNILKHNSLVAHNPYYNKYFLTKTKNKYILNWTFAVNIKLISINMKLIFVNKMIQKREKIDINRHRHLFSRVYPSIIDIIMNNNFRMYIIVIIIGYHFMSLSYTFTDVEPHIYFKKNERFESSVLMLKKKYSDNLGGVNSTLAYFTKVCKLGLAVAMNALFNQNYFHQKSENIYFTVSKCYIVIQYAGSIAVYIALKNVNDNKNMSSVKSTTNQETIASTLPE